MGGNVIKTSSGVATASASRPNSRNLLGSVCTRPNGSGERRFWRWMSFTAASEKTSSRNEHPRMTDTFFLLVTIASVLRPAVLAVFLLAARDARAHRRREAQ